MHLYIRICIRHDYYSQVPKYVSDIENVYTTRDTITVMSTGALAVSGFAVCPSCLCCGVYLFVRFNVKIC